MIRINLLPWREYKLKKQRVRFCAQLAFTLSMPILVCSAIWFYQHQILKNKVTDINKLKHNNQQQFAEMDDFETLKASFASQQPKIKSINLLVEKRFDIPELLLFLQQQNLDFEVEYLLINEHSFKLKARDSSTNPALSLLSNLRSESNFCQVGFTPIDGQDSSAVVKFELQAKFCDE